MTSNLAQLFEFFHCLEKLKTTPRQGWLRYPIIPLHQVESIADHMYRLSMMCMQLSDPTVDKLKCLKLALIHDVAESIVGDITPHCGISKEQKFELEKNAMTQLQTLLNSASGPMNQKEELRLLWLEYEDQCSLESQLIKQLDRLEMLLQAFEYEQRFAPQLNLSSFFTPITLSCFPHPELQQWYLFLIQKRELFYQQQQQQQQQQQTHEH